MTEENNDVSEENGANGIKGKASGYHGGGVDTVISVDEVTRQAAAIAEEISLEQLDDLAHNEPYVQINNLVAGYGQMQILHNLNLRVSRNSRLDAR